MRFPQGNKPLPEGYEPNHPHPWGWLAGLLKPLWPLVLMALVAVVGAAVSLLGIARGAQHLVDKSLSDPTGAALHMSLVFIMGCAVLMALSGFVRATTVNKLSTVIGERIRAAVFSHLLILDAQYHATRNAGDLVSRLSLEIGQIQTVVNTAVPSGIRNGLLLVGAVILMVATSWHLSLLALLAVPVLSVPILLIAPKLRRQYKDMNAATGDIGAFLAERLSAIRSVQLFAAEPQLNNELASLHGRVEDVSLRLSRLRGVLAAIVIVLVFLLIAFILWSGGQQVLQGKMTQGEVTAFVMYAVIAAASMASLMEMGTAIGQGRAALDRLLDVLTEQPVITSAATPKAAPHSVPSIRFENVTFTYPGASSPVLEGIDFTIEPRENIALVGPSGAGKTTIFSLLTRSYDPDQGCITLDGTDIREFDLQALRRLFGVIPQEPDIFALSVRGNVAFGLDDLSDERLKTATHQANIASAIDELEQAYETVLGERGLGLSVGQKQRLAIARALVREPKILLMDEATSALDAESEQLVQKALQDAARDRTAIVIAHRLATIRNARRILVMDKGRIVASGTHDSLIAQGGLYARLAELQFLA